MKWPWETQRQWGPELASEEPEALALAKESLIRAQEAGDRQSVAAAYRLRGQAERSLGRHEDAVLSFTHASEWATQAGKPLLAAQVRLGEIDSLAMLGRSDEAEALANSLADTFTALDAPLEAAKALCNLGSVYLRRDSYFHAADCYRRADDIFAEAGESAALMRALARGNRGIALMYLGEAEDAISLFEQASRVYEANGESYEAAVVEHNIGCLHTLSGRYVMGIASLERAGAAFRELARPLEAARSDIDQAEAYQALNLRDEAQERYNRALETFSGGLSAPYDQTRAILGRGIVLLGQGKGPESLAAFVQAEEAFRHQGNETQTALARLLQAQALLPDIGRLAEAADLARSAAAVFDHQGLQGWHAEAQCVLANIALKHGPPAAPEAARLQRRLAAAGRVAHRMGRGWLECRAEQLRALVYDSQGKTSLALRHFGRAADLLEAIRTRIVPEHMHTAFLSDKQDVFGDLVSLLLKRGRTNDIRKAFEYAERSRSRLLLDRVSASALLRETGRAPRAQLQELRARLARAYREAGALPADPSDPRRFLGKASPPIAEDDSAPSLTDLEKTYMAALHAADMSRSSQSGAGYTLTEDVITTDTLRQALAPTETFLSFYTSGDSVSVFVIGPKGVQAVPDIASSSQVELAGRRLRYHLQKMQLQGMPAEFARILQANNLEEIQAVLAHLYELLLKPLEPVIPGTATHLIVAPHGVLHGLPFHAFWDGSRYALDRWEITYAPSAMLWHQARNRPAAPAKEGNAVVVGLPSAALQRVHSEVERIALALPGARIVLGDDATVARVTEAARSATVLHLATHAAFRHDNPHFSGLQLADGWLLARDLYELAPLSCDLVTLSACETVVSRVDPGDELFGLIRGFLAAGARALLGSFWPADDAATADLMAEFYDARSAGRTAGAALRFAQQRIRENRPHPYHWAAFGLVGAAPLEEVASASQR